MSSLPKQAGSSDQTTRSQADILKAIQEKSRLIHQQQAKADRGEFKSYGGAIGLQRLRLERKELMGQLDKPKLVTD